MTTGIDVTHEGTGPRPHDATRAGLDTDRPDTDRPAAACAVPAGMPSGFAPTPLPVIGRGAAWSAVEGVALAFAAGRDEAAADDRFCLKLVDGEGEVLLRLGSLCEEEVVAVWRDCCRRSGLPRMILREDGSLAPVGRQLGPLALGTSRQRRRYGFLNGRRPRFLTRRKTARLPARPRIHRGESEIIART